ncbi:MAG TPA: YceI family protein [Myxococcaceae bacterium]|nr:YceI family protein [Myxococcaceae bacterium]
MKRSALSAALIAPMAFGTAALGAVYDIDTTHSTVQFTVKHLMVTNVKGEFSKFRGTVDIDEKDPTKSKAETVIETASVDTREPKRDEHLRSPDFFDAAKNPEMTFRSKSIRKAGTNKYKVTGDLTLKGVTKEVVLDAEMPAREVKDPYGNLKRGLTAATKINRKDFGLTWNAPVEAGGVVVGDEVMINLDLELTRRKDPGAAPTATTPAPTTTQQAAPAGAPAPAKK